VTPQIVLLVLAAAIGGFGLLLIVTAWTAPPTPVETRTTILAALPEHLTVKVGSAVAGGLVGLVATGWLVGGLAGAVAGWAATSTWLRRDSRRGDEQQRIEGLATWCEQLRDLLSADVGILGTIDATVATCPAALRAEVSRMSTRLARQAPEVAVRQFAVEVDDPSGDLVASVLLLAMSHSGRTAELLSELATTTRERASMRLRVEADRAGQRSEARFVLGFGILVIVGVVVFGRGSSFLDAYSSAGGQVVLAVVAGLYGTGIWWLGQLIRFERPARFLTNPAPDTEVRR
jgi:Flp pilus assembly protein TadB